MQSSSVIPYQKWHWSGDEVVQQTTIPASRPLPGTRNRRRYPIDIREFLSIEGNAVVRRELGRIHRRLNAVDRLRFLSRRAGNFDFRVNRVLKYFRAHLRFIEAGKRRVDDWLFPAETLANGGGDCEDLAFLLSAMLEESGISADCLRVALGTVVAHDAGGRRDHDHVWVVYQNERGAWEILEPLANTMQAVGARADKHASRRALSKEGVSVEYVPHFVLNRRHLWRVRGPDVAAAAELAEYLPRRRFWAKFDPGFAIGVHEGILDEALGGSLSADDMATVKRSNMWVDVNVLAYDPRDHFDFAYVPEGWKRVAGRLATGKLPDLALAAHGISDFYAHTMYGEFGPKSGGKLALYDPASPLPSDAFTYTFFETLGMPGSSVDAATAEAHWDGSLISGQWWRFFTTFPKALKAADDFAWRRALPDHDTLAVDAPQAKKGAPHFYDAATYAAQFVMRRDAAVRHVKQAYADWKRTS